jgi:hypothetical protein
MTGWRDHYLSIGLCYFLLCIFIIFIIISGNSDQAVQVSFIIIIC